jgi:hypothetical protein
VVLEGITINQPDITKVKKAITLLLPNEKTRKICLSLFLEALIKANSFGSNKWGAYYQSDGIGIRLLVGNLIVFTIHKGEIWLALDKQLLNESKSKQDLLENTRSWRWETANYSEYKPVPSRNGYYLPSEDKLQIWPNIRGLHFAYIQKVAKKYEWLNIRSQQKHAPDLLSYMRIELNKDIPNPNYDTDTIQEIEDFIITHKDLPETERNAIIRSRIGQGEFRTKLIEYWKKCAITGCEQINILKASHIKPWRSSNNIERLDKFNGLLLVPNLDSAFDKGLISFKNDGKIIISNLLDQNNRNKLGIHSELCLSKIDAYHIKYLEHHRKNVFLK